tara:strand:+ start:1059 stop:2105 length:1047 start_codon:yes stop_codon:yes gene_type:complete
MKITNIKAIYPKYKAIPPSWRTHLWQIVVKIETDIGIVGYGYGGGGKASVEVINHHFSEILVNQNVDTVDDISKIWDQMYFESIPYGRKGIAIMAMSGIDLALWDLLGKAENVPVYQLIGKRNKDKVRSYATGTDPNWYAEMGFTAHKFPHRWHSDQDYDSAISQSKIAREIFGPDALIMIDTYMTWDTEVTKSMSQRLKDFGIYWFEDVLTPDDLNEQSMLKESAKPTLISGGEHEFTHHGFKDILNTNALDLWQPDITWCGGITAMMKILDLANSANIPVVPHRGGEIWGLHLIVSSSCDDLAEVLPGTRDAIKDNLWIGEPNAENGFISPNDKPGFGVELNEELC